MKRLFIVMALLSSSCLYAQYDTRDYKMPVERGRGEYKSYQEVDKGFWCSVEGVISSSIRIEKINYQQVGLELMAGYRFSQYLKIGAGVGSNYCFHNAALFERETEWSFPLYGVFRGNFISETGRNAVPFWTAKVGAVLREHLMFNPSFGMRFGQSRKAFTVSLGYMYQYVGLIDSRYNQSVNNMTLSIGYEF